MGEQCAADGGPAASPVGHGFLLSMELRAPATNRPGPLGAGALLALGCANCCRASRVLKSRRPGPTARFPQAACRVPLADRASCGPRSDQPRTMSYWWPGAPPARAGLAWRQEWMPRGPVLTRGRQPCCCCLPYLPVVLNRQGNPAAAERGKALPAWHAAICGWRPSACALAPATWLAKESRALRLS